MAAITLVNVIEEQFGLEMDLDDVADLDSFEKVLRLSAAEATAGLSTSANAAAPCRVRGG